MKKVVVALLVLTLVFCSTTRNTVLADSTDEFLSADLNGSSYTKIKKTYANVTIYGDVVNGAVTSSSGVTIDVSAAECYKITKVDITGYAEGASPSTTSTTVNGFIKQYNFNVGYQINSIKVTVEDDPSTYNKKVNITIPEIKYGFDITSYTPTFNDDLTFKGQNLFIVNMVNNNPYNVTLTPTQKILQPGTYAILMVFESKDCNRFAMDDWCQYINEVDIDGSELFHQHQHCVMNYNLATGGKGVAPGDREWKTYLYVFPHYELIGLSVEYLANAGSDTVTNMPSNEEKAYLEDAPITVNSTDVPIRNGYEFLGWSLSENGEVITQTTMDSDGIKLYAKWKQIESVSPTIEEPVEEIEEIEPTIVDEQKEETSVTVYAPISNTVTYVPVKTCVD